uniref:DDRGK domain-containing protein 1 n=1 Tax=Phallusia mammillata TaxID=59560 RepID=A0A6F9DB89_9ASCI|nr:DDRGK domain-containing protein 1 [Phallusia mammillata]
MDEGEFKYDFQGLPDKSYMHYVLGFYASVLVVAIIGIGWKLRGYNKRNPKLHEVIDFAEKENPNIKFEARRRPVPREREADVPAARGGARRRVGGAARIQQEADRHRQQDAYEDSDEESLRENIPEESSAKMGAKKLKKMQEKEERRKMREAMEIERQERRQAQQERDEMEKAEEEKRKQEEEKKAEEERKIQEEKERREHEEYLKLKEMFSVEEEGQADITSEEQSQNLLQEFVTYIKENKVVLLEDLASHFGLRTQQAIDRVQEMLKDGILTGVIDDRGKFIYISTEELKAVAEFVEQRGRVSITELAQASNSLINLKAEQTLTLSSTS